MHNEKEKPLEKIKGETRKHPRIPVNLKLENWPIPQLKGCKVFSHNLSLGGMMVEIVPPLSADIDLKPGDDIITSFALSPEEDYLNVSSQIVWKKDKVLNPEWEEVTHMGIKFMTLPESIETLIKEFLEIESKEKSKEEKTDPGAE